MSRTRLCRSGGFTMMELIMTLAIVGILATVAAPSFKDLIKGESIRAASFDLVSSLTLARSEAIKQNGNVTVTPVSSAWENGWSITGPDSAVIRSQGAYTGITVTGPTTAVYNRSGRSTTSTAVSFQLSDSTLGSTVQGRCITLGLTGQPTSKLGTC